MAVSCLCEVHAPSHQAMANDVVDDVSRRNRYLIACPPQCPLFVQVEETWHSLPDIPMRSIVSIEMAMRRRFDCGGVCDGAGAAWR